MESQLKFITRIATPGDHPYITGIIHEMTCSASKRGASVTPRTHDHIERKMNEGLSVIAINPENGEWAGFCYLEVWQHEKFVANSGLIVSPKYRGMGISKEIKVKLFVRCRERFPHAKLFSLTTSAAVMHVNIELGYKVVPYADLMNDKLFRRGCNSWVNYVDLMTHSTSNSHYVAMVFDPVKDILNPTFAHTGKYLLRKRKSSSLFFPV